MVQLDFWNDFGGIPNDTSHEACEYNTDLFNTILQYNATNNTIVVGNGGGNGGNDAVVFHFYCGIYGIHVNNTILQIDATVRFEKRPVGNKEEEAALLPRYESPRHPNPCFMIDRSDNVTITSKFAPPSTNHRGVMDGRGSNYWGIPAIGYIETEERRPRLLRVNQTSNLLIENMIFQDSPYHTIYLESVTNVTIHNISIVARRTKRDGHSLLDLTAFNTDGIDVSGSNIHVHDIDIWNQDDCIAVKDSYYTGVSQHMLFENINASGLGFVIGSIGNTTVHNITFKNSYLHKPVKGIYMKFHEMNPRGSGGGHIDGVTYENITIHEPSQWSIWIGPAQQADSKRLCHANPCSLCWPQLPHSDCNVVRNSFYANITLSDITIHQPQMSPGVILGAYPGATTAAEAAALEDPDFFYHNNQHTDNDKSSLFYFGDDIPQIDGLLFHNVQVLKNRYYKSQQYSLNLLETFPGLKQPIVDHYIPSSIVNANFSFGGYGISILGLLLALLLTRKMIKWCWCPTLACAGCTKQDNKIRNNDSAMKRMGSYIELPLLLRQHFEEFDNEPQQEEDHAGKETAANEIEDPDDSDVLLLHHPQNDEHQHEQQERDGLRKDTITQSWKRWIVLFLRFFIIVFVLINIILWMILPAILPRDRIILMSNYMQRKSPYAWDNTNQYYKCTGVLNGIASGNTWPVPPCFQDMTASHQLQQQQQRLPISTYISSLLKY